MLFISFATIYAAATTKYILFPQDITHQQLLNLTGDTYRHFGLAVASVAASRRTQITIICGYSVISSHNFSITLTTISKLLSFRK